MTKDEVTAVLNRSAVGAWIALIVVVALVAWKGFDLIRTNRELIRETHRLVLTSNHNTIRAAALEREQRASCLNYLELRHAVNRFHTSMIRLLRTAHRARKAEYQRSHDPADLAAARQYQSLLSSLHTVKRTCVQRR